MRNLWLKTHELQHTKTLATDPSLRSNQLMPSFTARRVGQYLSSYA